MLDKLNDITKYFGFLMPVVSWGSIVLMILIHPINLGEPLSQFGYYDSTRLIFGLSLTVGSIIWYLFSRHLDRYWAKASLVTLAAGICYTIVGWVPYQPDVRTYLLDTHNLMVSAAAILYSLPMVFIGYSKKHEQLARVSRLLFIITFVLVIIILIARVTGLGVLYLQILLLTPTSIWLVITNKLLIEDTRLKRHADNL